MKLLPLLWDRLAATHAFRKTLKLLAVLAIVLGGVVLYLNVHGFPAPVTRRITEALGRAGLDIRFGALRLSLLDGVIADDARWYLDPGEPHPVLAIETLALRFDPINRLRGGSGVRAVVVRNGSLDLAPPGETGPGAGAPGPVVRHLFGEARIEPAGLRVIGLQAEFLGMDWQAEGLVLGVGRPGARPQVARALTGEALERMDRVVEALSALEFPGRPRVDLHFLLDPAHPAHNESALATGGPALRFRGLGFGAWKAAWRIEGLRHHLSLSIEGPGGGGGRAAADLDLAARTVDARLAADLPLGWWLALPVPERVRGALGRARLEGDGRVRVDAATRGAAPLETCLDRLSGRVHVESLGAFGVWLERLDARYERNGPVLELREIDGVIGRGAGRGPGRGEMTLDFAARRFFGHGTASFDPLLALPLLPPRTALHFGSTRCLGAPPRVDLDFSGHIDRSDDLYLHGPVAGTNVVYNGTYLARAAGVLTLTNNVLRLDELRVERPEGALTGWVEQDFTRRRARFEVESRINPHALARCIGPVTHAFAQHFRFEGPAHVHARGLADWGAYEATDFSAEVEGERMGIAWFVADRGSFRCAIKGRHVELDDLEGTFCGGDFHGAATFDLPPTRGGITHYSGSGTLTNADFAALYRRVSDDAGAAYRGRFSARVQLSGNLGEGQGPTVEGAGWVAIEEGELLRIPLFGGLSRLLARIYPGLGFASQSDFRASFRVADSRVTTDDARLEGGLLSVAARGECGFDERLHFVVQVKLLRRGPVAAVLRLVTFPITKLFEFELTGPYKDPAWRPKNLPKEMFLIFD